MSLLTAQVTADQYHANIEDWQTVDTVYGAIEPLSAAEQIVAGQKFGTVTHKMRTRHREDDEDLTFADGSNWLFTNGEDVGLVISRGPAMRASYGGRTFEIIGQWDIDERHRFDEWLMREVSVSH